MGDQVEIRTLVSQTEVEYNGVVLHGVRTLAFDETVQRDESGTDILYHQFHIRVESLVHSYTKFSTIDPDPPHAGPDAVSRAAIAYASVSSVQNASASDSMAALHARLMQDRGIFRYYTGNKLLLEATSAGNSLTRDVNNGPKPIFCNITHVAAGKVYRIEFEIEVCLVKCPGSSGQPSGQGEVAELLNNRWSCEDTYDENQYLTRYVDGVLRVSQIEKSPRAFLPYVIPPLPEGFRRERVKGLVSADGLTLRYSFQDRREYAAPPSPATSWEASYTETTSDSGASIFAEVSVRLEGPPDASKAKMLARCTQVVEARLGSQRRNYNTKEKKGGNWYVVAASIIEILNKNQVELRVRVRRLNITSETWLLQRVSTIGTFLDNPNGAVAAATTKEREMQGVPLPEYYPQKFPCPDVSTLPVGPFAMMLQDPCGSNEKHRLFGYYTTPSGVGVDQYGGQTPPKTDGTSATRRDTITRTADTNADWRVAGEGVVITKPEGLAKSVFSPDHELDLYLHYVAENRYVINFGKVMLPVSLTSSSVAGATPSTGATGTISSSTPTAKDTAVFARIHEPIVQRILRIVTERRGAQPVLPKMTEEITQTSGLKEVLLDVSYNPKTPKLSPDGTDYTYGVDVTYTYGLSRKPSSETSSTDKYRVSASEVVQLKDSDFALNEATAFAKEVEKI
jgi:hypothetical protein